MILDNIITKKEVAEVLQEKYNFFCEEERKARRNKTEFTATHYHGSAVACLRIAEKLGIKLDK